MAADILKVLFIANLAAAAAILVVLIVRAPLRRWLGPNAAYGLWLAVPMSAVATLVPGAPKFVNLPVATAPVAAPVAAASAAAAPAIAHLPAPNLDWPALILVLWIAGAVALAAVVVVRQRHALRMLGRMQHQVGDPPEVYRATGSDGPAIVGAVRPRIILPADFEERFEAHERQVIIAHETEHLIRGDVTVNAACAALACLNWFNPLVHLAGFAIRVDQELACDASVVARYPAQRRTYGAALLKTQLAGLPLPLGCYWPGRSHQLIRERLQTLALNPPGALRRITGMAFVVSFALSATVAAWAANPRPIVIAPPQAKPFWSPDGGGRLSLSILRGEQAREMILAQGAAAAALGASAQGKAAVSQPAAPTVKPGEGGDPSAETSPTLPPAAVPPCSPEAGASLTPCLMASGTLAELVESPSPQVRAMALSMLRGAEPADAARVLTVRNLGAGRTLTLFDGAALPRQPADGPSVQDYLQKNYSTPDAPAPSVPTPPAP